MNNKKDTIDLRKVAGRLWHRKKLYFTVFVITLILSVVWILPKPRFYDSKVSLAPEMAGADMAGGTLGSIASSFGVNLGDMQTSDAIYPELYPDLVSSSNFLVSLFNIKVKTEDGTISTDYYTYLSKHQKRSPWDYPGIWFRQFIQGLLPSKKVSKSANKKGGADAFDLSEQQDAIVNKLRNDITCNVDRKNNVITISVRDQDRLICATMADSVRVRLQKFITDYRTSKARNDVEYYDRLTSEAKRDYERVRQTYSAYSDANMDVILQSFKSKQEDLENDMQLKFNTYTAFNTQLQAAKAKLQEHTPAFTIIQAATMPIKPSGPKRMIFIVGMMFLAFVATSAWILRKDLCDLILPKQ